MDGENIFWEEVYGEYQTVLYKKWIEQNGRLRHVS